MAARFAVGDDGLAQLSRQHQDTARELTATDALILTAWGDGNTEQAETLKGRSESLTEQLVALSSDLRDRTFLHDACQKDENRCDCSDYEPLMNTFRQEW